MTGQPSAVLFDARRTLLHIDPEELLADLAAEGGPNVGFDDHDVHAALILADDIAAPGTTAHVWCGLLGLPESAVEACSRALARAQRRCDLDPHARTVLHALRERGVRLGALVDDPEQLAGLPTPDVVVTGTRVEEALARLGVPAEECWFVGSAVTPLLVARAAGVGRVMALVRYGRRRAMPGIETIDELPALILPDASTDATAALVDVGEAARLADLTVHALSTLWDPEAQGISAPMWVRTRRLGHAVLDALTRSAAGAQLPVPLTPALDMLRAAPLDRACRRAVRDAVRHLLMLYPAAADALSVPVRAFERRNRLDQWLGERYVPGGQLEETSARQIAAASKPCPRQSAEAWRLTVVLDFRDRDGGARLRNTIATLAALNDQTLPRSDYRVVVVEQDSVPRHRELVEPLVDRYIHTAHGGTYKRSWAHNVGAVATGRAERYLCFLDTDVMPERTLLAEAIDFMDLTGARALLPHSSLLYLDQQSSESAIRRRLLSPERAVAEEECNGYRLMTNRGGCIFVESALFYQLGGYDERFEGWGDEDNEFFDLLAANTRVFQLAHDLIHLYHPRSPMVESNGRRANDWVLHNPDGRPVDIGDPNRVPVVRR